MFSSDIIHIFSCIDRNYLQHLGVLLVSIFENKSCGNHIVYHVLHTDLGFDDQKALIGIVSGYNERIMFHDMSEFHDYDNVKRFGQVSKAALFRLSIADILPNSIEKVLYLDSDMVINNDLYELWNTELDNYQVAAVEDAPIFDRYDKLLMPKRAHYFNSGVLLINLKAWRQEGTSAKIVEFLIKYPERRAFNDQDGLNAVLHSKWLRLPPIYNQQTAIFYLPLKRLTYTESEYRNALKNPVIIHYSGVISNLKPWEYSDIHPNKKLYYKYLKLTQWSDFRPKCKNISEILKKLYYRILRMKMKSGIVLLNLKLKIKNK